MSSEHTYRGGAGSASIRRTDSSPGSPKGHAYAERIWTYLRRRLSNHGPEEALGLFLVDGTAVVTVLGGSN